MSTCGYCAKEVSRVADIRYCAVCKGAGRVPDPEVSDDAPIDAERLAALQPVVQIEAAAAPVASKSRLKREAIQKRVKKNIPAKKRKKKKK